MIDFIKIALRGYSPELLERNPLLTFFDSVNIITGVIRTTNKQGSIIIPRKTAFYNSLQFTIYDNGNITIEGSLHKYWNRGAHNYNDFNLTALDEVLKELKHLFNIKPEQCYLRQLELGVNIRPPIQSHKIIDNCFLHKTTPFEYVKNSDEGKYKQAEHSQFYIKIYDKARHYKKFEIKGEILRFEIKYRKMEKLNKKGIYTLNDLLEYGLHNFKDDLLQQWQNVLFYDPTIKHKTIKLLNYSNPNYWQTLIDRPTNTAFNKHRTELNNLIENHSNNIKGQIHNAINQKVDFLTSRGVQTDSLYIGSIPTPPSMEIRAENERICKITGLNISMQKDYSLMLSHTGLKYYFDTDKKIFEQVKRKYLPEQYFKDNTNAQIKRIAHNIRNTMSNKNIRKKKRIKELQNQYPLF